MKPGIDNIAVRRFDRWFESEYYRLRNQLSTYRPLNEDVFHDTYLRVRQCLLFSGEEMVDYTAYFLESYRCNRLKRSLFEARFYHPEDSFFQALGEEPAQEPEIQKEVERLATDILKYVRGITTPQEYRIFCLKSAFPGCSYGELSLYTGMSISALYRRVTALKTAVLHEGVFLIRKQYLSIL
jgi:hypothetical protein|nr:MAG TPA: putative RNA polymerase [Caudoviricetes sp.]